MSDKEKAANVLIYFKNDFQVLKILKCNFSDKSPPKLDVFALIGARAVQYTENVQNVLEQSTTKDLM